MLDPRFSFPTKWGAWGELSGKPIYGLLYTIKDKNTYSTCTDTKLPLKKPPTLKSGFPRIGAKLLSEQVS